MHIPVPGTRGLCVLTIPSRSFRRSGAGNRRSTSWLASLSPNTGLYDCLGMRVIAPAALKAFLGAKSVPADAREPVMA